MQIGRRGQSRRRTATRRTAGGPPTCSCTRQPTSCSSPTATATSASSCSTPTRAPIKRMWGAFGNEPARRRRTARRRRGRPHARTELDPNDPGPQQFSTVHGVKVSNDGLVYAADRGGKRVQVFTIEGRYLAQAWIDRWCLAAGQGCGNGETAASVAFSADRSSASSTSRAGVRRASGCSIGKTLAAARFVRPPGHRARGVQRAAPHDDRFEGQPLHIGSPGRPAHPEVRVQRAHRGGAMNDDASARASERARSARAPQARRRRGRRCRHGRAAR